MTSTLVSWGLTLALVGVVTYFYKPEIFTQLLSQSRSIRSKTESVDDVTKSQSKKSKPKNPISSKAANSDSSASSGPVSKKDVGYGTAEVAKSGQRSKAGTLSGNDSQDQGDKEFAQQLAKTQAGTKLQKADGVQGKKKSKTRKQSQLEQSSSVSPDPITEQAANDETSTFGSTPPEAIAANGQALKAGDVSDMLEARAPKPTTIRLTGISGDSQSKKKAASKSTEPALTKKQRQNQARKEEMRQFREESDRMHEAKKQEQLRRARMADGISNQTRADQFGSSGTNAWQSKSQEKVKAAPANSTPLLDTFEPNSAAVSHPNGIVSVQSVANNVVDSAAQLKDTVGETKASAIAASSREGSASKSSTWVNGLSEEDQIKLIEQQDADNAWEDVTTKKTKRKSKKESDAVSDAGVSTPVPVQAVAKPKTNGAKTRPVQPEPDLQNRFNSFQGQGDSSLADADWEA